MIKKQYTGSARRARNIIWNAAGRYDFEPYFMAFFPNGAPDHYFNMITGLAVKWLDADRLVSFFRSYLRHPRRDEIDEYLWLGLENCLYEKEIRERPQMRLLREERARRFFKEQENLSRQQMEYQSAAVYSQQQYRWSLVLGKRGPLLSPREKRIAAALLFPGELNTDEVISRMEGFLSEFFRFTPSDEPFIPRPAGTLARLLLRREHRRQDRLIVRAGTGEGDHERASAQRHEGLGRYTGPTEKDDAYVRAVFGRSRLSEGEERILSNDLCVGIDGDCRLLVTDGKTASSDAGGGSEDAEISEIREAIRRQSERNRAFHASEAAQIRHSIRDLSTRIDTMLSSYLKHMPEPSRAGRIRPEAAYRLPVLGDTRVFLKDGEETEPEICVDILLDASQSRMHSQETLASEAYVIAESLRLARIPVRVSTFRSLRGYTVLETLKDWTDRNADGVFRYFAAGWNRDALALRTLAHLDDGESAGKQRMLLILTDASPNDSTPMAGEGLRLSREYEGAAAVKAAEDAVRDLRSQGLRVGAVFHGNTSHLDDLHQIYGHTCVRIRKIPQLAQGVSDLLLMMLRETYSD